MTKRTPSKTRSYAKKSPDKRSRRTDANPRPGGKLGLILDRLDTRKGATIDALIKATGWQKHSVYGALSRLRTRGFTIRLEADKDERKVYKIAPAEA